MRIQEALDPQHFSYSNFVLFPPTHFYLHFVLSPTSQFCIYILSCLQHPTSVSANIPILYLNFVLSLTSHFCIYILSCLQHPTSVSTFYPVSTIPLLYLHFVRSPTSHFCIYILSCLHHPTSMSRFCPVPTIPLLRRIPLCPLSPLPPHFFTALSSSDSTPRYRDCGIRFMFMMQTVWAYFLMTLQKPFPPLAPLSLLGLVIGIRLHC
jgi:hypothetical protein